MLPAPCRSFFFYTTFCCCCCCCFIEFSVEINNNDWIRFHLWTSRMTETSSWRCDKNVPIVSKMHDSFQIQTHSPSTESADEFISNVAISIFNDSLINEVHTRDFQLHLCWDFTIISIASIQMKWNRQKWSCCLECLFVLVEFETRAQFHLFDQWSQILTYKMRHHKVQQ